MNKSTCSTYKTCDKCKIPCLPGTLTPFDFPGKVTKWFCRACTKKESKKRFSKHLELSRKKKVQSSKNQLIMFNPTGGPISIESGKSNRQIDFSKSSYNKAKRFKQKS